MTAHGSVAAEVTHVSQGSKGRRTDLPTTTPNARLSAQFRTESGRKLR